MGTPPVTGEFPAQKASNAEMFPFDDAIMNNCDTDLDIPEYAKSISKCIFYWSNKGDISARYKACIPN